ncbi:hypothetical protein [Chitinivibrio alkaliphilus]|uniref:LPP20 lipoprotein n=1 Tax=Chitinivibrio alkaliphilus ACht1 TaxID=1313304 RepID=U7D8E4_9BACT|nr:hypothetical protein [Chitinivibrio alkaliphilus]ERP31342.1 hypothetical protein CALK_1832 [Chitinivibrio alkaliphilus ACht1]
MKILLLLWAPLWCVSFCSVACGSEIATPSWVESRPVEDGWYIGIGRGRRHSLTEVGVDVARRDAFKQISRETGISLDTLTQLPDITRIATWESTDDIWVYYRMERDHPYLRRHAVQEELYSIEKRLDRSSVLLKRGEISRALGHATRAFAEVQMLQDNRVGEDLSRHISRVSERTESVLETLFDNISFIAETPYRGPLTNIASHPPVTLIWTEKQPLPHIPVRFSITQGNASIPRMRTSEQGEIAIRPQEIVFSEQLVIEASIDVEPYLSGFSSEFRERIVTEVDLLSPPVTNVVFELTPIPIQLVGKEAFFGEEKKNKELFSSLQEFLSTQGYMLSRDSSKFTFYYTADTRFRGEQFGVVTVDLLFTLSVECRETDTQVLTASVPKIRVNGATKEAAAEYAYSQGKKMVIPVLEKALFQSGL